MKHPSITETLQSIIASAALLKNEAMQNDLLEPYAADLRRIDEQLDNIVYALSDEEEPE